MAGISRAGCLLAFHLALFPAVSLADEEEMGYTPEHILPSEPWREQRIELPSWPEEGRLLEVPLNIANFPYRMFIDPDSLSLGDDRVLRYTTVIVSASGARNVSFEGMRCGERLYRRYAYGSGDQWRHVKDAAWERATGGGGDHYRSVLYRDYLCDADNPGQDIEGILLKIRRSRHSSPIDD